jgi:hypothetical protein
VLKVAWDCKEFSMMLEPGNNDMPNKTKAFPYSAEAFEKYIKGGIAGIVFPTFFLLFRPHFLCASGVQ